MIDAKRKRSPGLAILLASLVGFCAGSRANAGMTPNGSIANAAITEPVPGIGYSRVLASVSNETNASVQVSSWPYTGSNSASASAGLGRLTAYTEINDWTLGGFSLSAAATAVAVFTVTNDSIITKFDTRGAYNQSTATMQEIFVTAGTTTQFMVTAHSYSGQHAYHVVRWILGPAPGGDPNNPRDYDGPANIYIPTGQGKATTEEGPSVANHVTGGYLTSLPVDGEFGVTAPVYFSGSLASPSAQALNSHASSIDFYFRSISESSFTSFVAPHGIGGDTSQLIIDDGITQTPYIPGTTHTFSAPMRSFILRGLDESANPADRPVPFVHGFTFDGPGSAIFLHNSLPVPEPSTLTLGLLALVDLGLIARRGR